MLNIFIYTCTLLWLWPQTEVINTNITATQISHENTNRTDETGLKQGYWIVKDNESVIEEGNYLNDKKNGLWKSYFTNGNLKSEITYEQGVAKGNANHYYKDGTLRESGNWQVDHWEGGYKYYYESGQLSYDWFYNENGKRQGEQRYFHANGKKMYEGNWQDGKTEGVLKVYNESGLLVQEKVYNNGKFAEIKEHTNNQHTASNIKFSGTGFHTVTNLAGQVEEKGFYVKGKLFDGEKRNYDQDGNLVSVINYKNGVVVVSN